MRFHCSGSRSDRGRGSISDGSGVADGGSDDRNVRCGAAGDSDSRSNARVAARGSGDNALSLSLADVAVRVDDGVGLLGASGGKTVGCGDVFGLVDVCWLGLVGCATADGADFADGGSLPDPVEAL